MSDLAHQREYWDAKAESAVFTHPLDLEELRRHVLPSARILDFGCGYGRLLRELQQAGFTQITGFDASPGMAARAARQLPDVPIAVRAGLPTRWPDGHFDAVLLFAVLTCIPRDADQRAVVAELRRLLAPGGTLHVSDLLLHSDLRNRERYAAGFARFGTFGIFQLEGAVVLRHHCEEWIRELFAAFETVAFTHFEATTMRGNPAAGFRYAGRR